MRRLLFAAAVVAVGVVFSAGLTYAQETDPKPMPEKVRKFLEYRTGTWSIEGGPATGTLEYKWDSKKYYIIGDAHLMINGVPHNETSLWCWDEMSEDKIRGYTTTANGYGIGHARIISDTLVEVEATGVTAGQKAVRKIRYALNGPDQYTTSFTGWMVGGQRRPDWTGIYTKVKPTTHEDFDEYCKLNEGRWVGDVTFQADLPGLGKKGEKVTAYYEGTMTEDGNVLIEKFYEGKGTGTGFTVYDAGTKQIETVWMSSGGHKEDAKVYRLGDKWIAENTGCMPDGTKTESLVTLFFTDNGNKLLITGSGTVGGESTDDIHNVWHRVSK